MTLSSEAYQQSYLSLPPLECELWRRIFWVVYYGDRTTVLLDDRLSLLHEDECSHVAFPTEMLVPQSSDPH